MTVSNPDTRTPWVDSDDAPELTEAWFAKAVLHEGEKPVNRGGRPRGSDKEQIALRVDKDALARFRAMGAGWQSRMNEALRRAVEL